MLLSSLTSRYIAHLPNLPDPASRSACFNSSSIFVSSSLASAFSLSSTSSVVWPSWHPTAFGEGNRLFTEFKTENFVLQTLITQFEVVPRYWTQSNPPYELDFLIQRENDIFPVEMKAEDSTSSRSLKKFKELFPDKVKLRIRFSLDNLYFRFTIHRFLKNEMP